MVTWTAITLSRRRATDSTSRKYNERASSNLSLPMKMLKIYILTFVFFCNIIVTPNRTTAKLLILSTSVTTSSHHGLSNLTISTLVTTISTATITPRKMTKPRQELLMMTKELIMTTKLLLMMTNKKNLRQSLSRLRVTITVPMKPSTLESATLTPIYGRWIWSSLAEPEKTAVNALSRRIS